MTVRRHRTSAFLVGIATLILAACSSAPATLPPGLIPVTLGLNGNPTDGTRDYTDSIDPGSPFSWAIRIGNATDQEIIVDGYELVGQSPGLEVVAAGLLPTLPPPAIVVVPTPASADVEATVAARPLAGATFGGRSSAGWTDGGLLAFILRVPSAGDFALSGVHLRYHVGGMTFDTTLNAALEVCAGAASGADTTCPFVSPAASS